MIFNPFVSFTDKTDEELEDEIFALGDKIATMRRFRNMASHREQLELIYNQMQEEKTSRYLKTSLPSEDAPPEIIELGTIQAEQDDK